MISVILNVSSAGALVKQHLTKSKRYQISNGIKKKLEKSKPVKSHELKSKGNCSLSFDYVKNSPNNHSV
jgi:hypothetical protein